MSISSQKSILPAHPSYAIQDARGDGLPGERVKRAMVSLPSARDASDDVLRALDPELNGSALLPFAVHRNAGVRAAVAARTDCPAGALISLGHDHDTVVLEALLRNVRTPSSVVRALADHRNQKISDLAVQRLRNGYR